MRTKLTYLIIGGIIGIISTISFIKLQDLKIDSPERKKDAIIYAQKLIEEEFGKEHKMSWVQGQNQYYEGITFPPVTTTKVVFTEFKTYVIELFATYHSEREVQYITKGSTYYIQEGDNFYVELEYTNDNWTVIELRRVGP